MKKFKITINNKVYDVEIKNVVAEKGVVTVNGVDYEVEIEGMREKRIGEREARAIDSIPDIPVPSEKKITSEKKPSILLTGNNSVEKIIAPLSGLIIDLLIKEGDRVKTGQTVLRMEAMKMENDIVSPQDGIIRKIMVTKGAEVREGDILIEFGKS